MCNQNEYRTKEEVMAKAQELLEARKTFRELDVNGRLGRSGNKGSLGQIVEEGWYGYHINSDSEPDFPIAGVELKVSPYKTLKNGDKSAGERLSCNMINYMEEVNKTFEESAFWHKCKCICLLSYERSSKSIPRGDCFADHATLIDGFPEEDLLIMKQDYEIIMGMIREGRAHELTEGITKYLSPATKATSADSRREQPYSDIPAKPRAYSLKTGYMTRLLRKYIFGEEENEHIITDFENLREHTFEELIEMMIRPYYGKTQQELKELFGIETSSKNLNAVILKRIFNLNGNIENTEEFRAAGIIPKTIRLKRDGTPKEDMSFPAFKFMDIIEEEWDDSTFKNYIEPARFMFIVFEEGEDGQFRLSRIKFWNVTADDLDKIKVVWDDTVEKIRNDAVNFRYDARTDRVYNDFIGTKQSSKHTMIDENGEETTVDLVCHVRPHTRVRSYVLRDGTQIRPELKERYASQLPYGDEWASIQSFWFNKSYIKSVLAE